MMLKKIREYFCFARTEKFLSGISLCLLIFIIWSWLFNIYNFQAWRVPVGYQGDAWIAFAFAKAYMDGDIYPFFYQFVPTLNAPFVANWNDYAVTEDFVYASMGWLGRIIGLYAAANFMVLLAHILAGLSFWYVCRELKYKKSLAFAGGILYAFCHYIMARSLGHLVLSYFWHIPLLMLVTTWVFSNSEILFNSRKFYLSICIALVCGALNPYYTGMFVQFLFLGFLFHIVRKEYSKARFSFILIASSLATFFLMNANTIFFGIANGVNRVTGGRNLASLEIYGLKIPELFLSPGNHFFNLFVQFSQYRYYGIAFIKGEYWSPYLGFSAIAGFIILIGLSFYRLLQGKLKLIPIQFWLTLWILLYSVVGGLNLLLGTLGIQYFRATNRYSIFILTIALLFLIRFLSRKCPKYLIIPIAFLMVCIGFGEEFTARFKSRPPAINPIMLQVESDKSFALAVERSMPNSMVFQLPVADYPEIGPIHNMGDYEHFRPYFYTKTLHYSYGGNKGRGDADWQKVVAQLQPRAMSKKLEEYGFGVVMINRKGYVDGGEALIKGFLRDGKCIISENKDLVAIALSPIESPMPIEALPYFSSGWSDSEGAFRWSQKSRVEVILTNSATYPRPYFLSFKLSALTPRNITVSMGGKDLGQINLKDPGKEVQFSPIQVFLPSGKTSLSFVSDSSPVSPQNGDPRMLSFKISDFQLESDGKGDANKGIGTKSSSQSESIRRVNSRSSCPVENGLNSFSRISEVNLPILFSSGWSDDEGTHRWSISNKAQIILTNPNQIPKLYSLEFKLTALAPRRVSISLGSKIIEVIDIDKPGREMQFKKVNIKLPPGRSTISLNTDSLPIRPNNGDERMLSLKISDISFSQIGN